MNQINGLQAQTNFAPMFSLFCTHASVENFETTLAFRIRPLNPIDVNRFTEISVSGEDFSWRQ